MQSAVHVFHERRARRDGQELRQEVPQQIAHRDRAIGPADANVHVQAKRVVAPDDVPEKLVVPAVVRRVNDALVLPAAPRMRPRRPEPEAERLHDVVQLRAALGHPLRQHP